MEENKKSASPKKNCACGGGVGVGIEGRAIDAIDAIDAIVAIEIVGVEGRGCCGLGGCVDLGAVLAGGGEKDGGG